MNELGIQGRTWGKAVRQYREASSRRWRGGKDVSTMKTNNKGIRREGSKTLWLPSRSLYQRGKKRWFSITLKKNSLECHVEDRVEFIACIGKAMPSPSLELTESGNSHDSTGVGMARFWVCLKRDTSEFPAGLERGCKKGKSKYPSMKDRMVKKSSSPWQ